MFQAMLREAKMFVRIAGIAVLIFAALLAFPSAAKPTHYVPLTLAVARAFDAKIPARFDIAKVGMPDAIIHYMSRRDVRQWCGPRRYACEFKRPKYDLHPQIIIEDTYKGTALDYYLRRHELAHALGWPADHSR